MIPLLDLQAQYSGIEQEVIDRVVAVIQSKQFIMGPDVAALEAELSAYLGVPHVLGISSGTDALLLALMALGVGPGDEVITSPFTFFATAGSISRVGATPVFVDIDDTFNMNPDLIESKITNRTKAIMPVHLFGQMADMDPIMNLAKQYQLAVIEDAAQAIGAMYHSKDGQQYMAGSMGDVGCFSFFPSKNLGAIGDAGAVMTHRSDLGETMRLLRVHGAKERYYHQLVGANFRLDSIQAAALRVKLKSIEDQHEARIKNAQYYNQLFAGSGVMIPVVRTGGRMIYNQYTIRVSNRNHMMSMLTEKGIGHAIYYPVPLHLQDCFKHLGYEKGSCPVAETMADQVLSIPIYGELTTEQLDRVAQVVIEAERMVPTH